MWKFILWHATRRPWDHSIDDPFPLVVFSDLTRLPPSDFGRLTARLLSHCFSDRSIDCRLNNDKTRPSDHAVVARLSPPSAAAWPLARLLLPGICSVVCLPVGRPSTPTLAWQLQRLSPSPAPLRPSPALSASTACSPVPGRFSDFRRDAARSIVRVDVTISRRRQRRRRKHVLSYENGGCQFAGPYLYEVCSWVPSTKCHGWN